MTAPVPPPRVRRSRTGAVLGGVCAGIARSAGLDPLLLRIALVAVTVLTGGAGVPAYLVAWVLIPREPVDATASGGPPPADTPATDTPATDAPGADAPADAPPGTIPAPRSPLTAADDAATALGDRLRAPEVQAEARKAAASVTEAVNASVDELARRVRRDRS